MKIKRMVNIYSINLFLIYIFKFFTMILAFLIIPAYIKYFPSNNLVGFFLTLISIFNFFLIFDFGVSSSMRNFLIYFLKRKNESLNEVISSTFIFILILSILFFSISFFIIFSTNFISIFPLEELGINSHTFKIFLIVMVISTSLRFFSVLISNVFYSLQKSFLPNLILFISNLFLYIYLILFRAININDGLLSISIVLLISNNFPVLIASIILFKSDLLGFFPKIKFFKFDFVIKLFINGFLFFLIQIIHTILFNVKEVFINFFGNNSNVLEYQLFSKIIGFLSAFYLIGLTPVWGLIRKKYIENNFNFIRKAYYLSFSLLLLISIIQIIIVFISPFLFNIWIGNHIYIENFFSKGFITALFYSILMVITLNMNFHFGTGFEKLFLFKSLISLFLFIILSYFFHQLYINWESFLLILSLSSLPLIFPALKFKSIKIVEKELNINDNSKVGPVV